MILASMFEERVRKERPVWMARLRLVPLGMMAFYSGVLVTIELSTSQDHVRHYFTDIEGPVRLFAINTTLSVFLLWASALLFAVVLMVIRPESRRERLFCLSQMAIFGYLGVDDRFLLHERLSDVVPLHDTLILVAVGLVEIAALALLGDLRRRSGWVRGYVAAAGVLFGVMAAIDAFAPSDAVLRLAVEDLSKVWAGWFLFLFSWRILEEHVTELRRRAR